MHSMPTGMLRRALWGSEVYTGSFTQSPGPQGWVFFASVRASTTSADHQNALSARI